MVKITVLSAMIGGLSAPSNLMMRLKKRWPPDHFREDFVSDDIAFNTVMMANTEEAQRYRDVIIEHLKATNFSL